MSRIRRATHAGSWYSEHSPELSQQLSGWLTQAGGLSSSARAIIAPHAGYSYCGSCGAHAYKQVDPSKVKKVFILGPSHHVRLAGCALSGVEKYETPLYNLNIDQKICEELHSTGLFQTMSLTTDEDEHSIEMHLPYIAKVMERFKGHFTIVPILVGSLTSDKEQEYGRILSPYLADPDNLFVISSDFCHWGQRFKYTYYNKSCGEIWQSIENLDRMGMNLIEAMDPVAFSEYLKSYQNTICGRHPIAVLLNAIAALRGSNGHTFSLQFLNYAQSSQCRSKSESSVSYASAALTISK